jgi:hypothetical protein
VLFAFSLPGFLKGHERMGVRARMHDLVLALEMVGPPEATISSACRSHHPQSKFVLGRPELRLG